LVLPLIFAALFALYCDWAFGRGKKQRVVLWVLALTLLTVTGTLLSAAADLYIVFTAVLLLLQRAVVTGQFRRLAGYLRNVRRDKGVVLLSEAERLVHCGNKAYRLARLRTEGVPVPDGAVLTPEFLKTFAAAMPEARRKQLDRLWREVGAATVAVRSSAAAEDGTHHSFAGVFESVLNVDRAGLEDAIASVTASFTADRVKSYGMEGGGGSIIVQRMIDAEYAGVLFTRDPLAGGLAMVELVRGTAEGLVSGAVAPDTFRCGSCQGR
jgi:rifampicin phosphotransferase